MGARRLEGSHFDVTVLVILYESAVDGNGIRQRGKAGNLNSSPEVREARMPSHLHSDSPKSQHNRHYVANWR